MKKVLCIMIVAVLGIALSSRVTVAKKTPAKALGESYSAKLVNSEDIKVIHNENLGNWSLYVTEGNNN